MAECSFATLQIVRFAELASVGDIDTTCPGGSPAFWAVGFDGRDAKTDARKATAFWWCGFGVHSDEASARAALVAGALERGTDRTVLTSWTALLQPFSQRGAMNWLDRDNPGPVFAAAADDAAGGAPPVDEPIVVITTVGHNFGRGFKLSRALEFGRAVDRVYDAMSSSTPAGLRFRRVFTFPDYRIDPITVTWWDDAASMRAFAYRPGAHKTELDRVPTADLADRTSFTRLRVVEAIGSDELTGT